MRNSRAASSLAKSRRRQSMTESPRRIRRIDSRSARVNSSSVLRRSTPSRLTSFMGARSMSLGAILEHCLQQPAAFQTVVLYRRSRRSVGSAVTDAGALDCRPRERVPTKMQRVTASTAQWPRNAPEQPATAIGATATRYQWVSFMLENLRGIRLPGPELGCLLTCKLSYDIQRQRGQLLQMSNASRQAKPTRLARTGRSKWAHVRPPNRLEKDTRPFLKLSRS